jgi:single-stranded-DNA-specific exonuclease
MPTRARWIFPSPEDGRATRLARDLSLSAIAARVLVHRGYAEPAVARSFLAASLDELGDPFQLRDMDRAVRRLTAAVQGGEPILLYGDYDVDGTSSIVILTKTLEILGAHPSYHVPHRLRDGYGMRSDVVERAAAEGVRLILSVDTGIRAGEVVRHANTLGIDVIVTDHHLPEEELPPAAAVINPNRPDCGYPEKNLCGAGVAFKLVDALLRALDWPWEKRLRLLDSLLKIAAIATVADVVPLTGENRIIVRNGLAGLSNVRNPGLRALLRVAGVKEGESPSARHVAFQIAPRINAAGRMADASDVVELFLTADESAAAALATELDTRNRERQQTEEEIRLRIEEHVLSQPVDDSQAALVFAGRDWHRGVVGIVASRVVDRFHRPAFVLDIAEDGFARGSGRSIRQFHLLEALESMRDLFAKFGGHRQAAGVTLPVERLDEFRLRFSGYAAARLTPDDFRPLLEIDAEAGLDDLNDRVATDLFALAPFGFGNPTPVLAARGVELREAPQVIKEKHLRFRVWRNGRPLELKAWNFAHRAEELVPGRSLDIALQVDEDDWSAARGYGFWSCSLRDFRPSE